jgi:hypothetical protein
VRGTLTSECSWRSTSAVSRSMSRSRSPTPHRRALRDPRSSGGPHGYHSAGHALGPATGCVPAPLSRRGDRRNSPSGYPGVHGSARAQFRPRA